MVSGLCDYMKQKQFLLLTKEVNKQLVTVQRGQYGSIKSIPIKDIVVGDIVELS